MRDFFLRVRLGWYTFKTGLRLTADGWTTSPEVGKIAIRGMRNPEALTLSEIRSCCASLVAQLPRKDRRDA
jgi:hypothetical protein